MAKTYNEYKKQAQQEYDPSYNAKVTAINNALNEQTTNLENQKGTINQNYDTQVQDQNLQNTVNKNNISNSALNRGLGRSSIVTSGLAEADQNNSKLLQRINQSRTNALNDIDTQKTMLKNNASSTLTQMAGDRESELATLIRQYQESDREYNFRKEQFDWQKQQAQQQLALQRQQLAAAALRARNSSSARSSSRTRSSSSSNSTKNSVWAEFEDAIRSGQGDEFLNRNYKSIIQYLGASEYYKMKKQVDSEYKIAHSLGYTPKKRTTQKNKSFSLRAMGGNSNAGGI